MLLLREPTVGKKKQTSDAKERTWPQRKGKVQSQALYRDVAGWLTYIANYLSQETGEKISVAMVADLALRDWAWNKRRRILNVEIGRPNDPIPKAPDPPEPIPDLKLP